jgi:hypothetical protein
MYTTKKDLEQFGIKKIIFGDSGINPVHDHKGEYGMTHHAMAIRYDTEEEAKGLVKALTSSSFKNVLDSCLFSSYGIDWNIFKAFKKNWWTHFQ